MMLVGVTGPAASGKDTVADYLHDQYGFERVSFAAPIYRALSAMLRVPEADLRDRAKKERDLDIIGRSPRELLQTLGTEWGRDTVRNDFWLLLALREIERHRRAGAPGVVITDVRFGNEANFVRGQGGQVWHIQRPGTPAVRAHSSEIGVAVLGCDRGLLNDGPIAALCNRVDRLIDDLTDPMPEAA
jgi:hypothetical protein